MTKIYPLNINGPYLNFLIDDYAKDGGPGEV